MRISIVTPTFNSSLTILGTCRSIIRQNYENFEHIVVDNLSRDGTVELVCAYYQTCGKEKNLRVICEKDFGIADAFNKGITASSGEIVAILNSDDAYHDSRTFSAVSRILATRKDVSIVHGKMLFEDDLLGSNLRAPMLCNIRTAMPLNHPTMFVRKSLYETYGLFDLSYRYAMDFEWLCRFYPTIDPKHFYYLEDFPIAVMNAGGATSRQELKTLLETKRALRKHALYDNRARYGFWVRFARIRVKNLLLSIKLNSVIRLWRSLKWKKQ